MSGEIVSINWRNAGEKRYFVTKCLSTEEMGTIEEGIFTFEENKRDNSTFLNKFLFLAKLTKYVSLGKMSAISVSLFNFIKLCREVQFE